MVKKKVFALDVLQFKRFSMLRNLMENCCQNGSKKPSKCNQKSPGRRIFEILGRSGRRCFFDVFGDNKKSAKILKNPTLWFQRGVRVVISGRPGGMRGATGEVRRG